MIAAGPLGFTAPWLLTGLFVLPLLYWLTRLRPPPPKTQAFPPFFLLHQIITQEETPARTPLLLLLLRLLIVTLFVLGLAKPVLFPTPDSGARARVLVIDDGWAAAGLWERLTHEALISLQNAERAEARVALLFTAPPYETSLWMSPEQAQERLENHHPKAWPVNRIKAMQFGLKDIKKGDKAGEIVWFSDGVDDGSFQEAFAFLRDTFTPSSLRLYTPPPETAPLGLIPPRLTDKGFEMNLIRVKSEAARSIGVSAYDRAGESLAKRQVRFEKGQEMARLVFSLPSELVNRLSVLRVEDYASAGATTLVDSSWGRPRVGLVSDSPDTPARPLLSGSYYLQKALTPHTHLEQGKLEDILQNPPAALFMTDYRQDKDKELQAYVEDGGLLVVFATPQLTEQASPLFPVRLRSAGRDLGGALRWDKPRNLDVFSSTSPFTGLTIPQNLKVRRQILTQPEPDLEKKIWARLEDGTPLVTSAPFGKGRVVFFHIAPQPNWSDLPLHGLFVDMLQRVLSYARHNTPGEADIMEPSSSQNTVRETYTLTQTLDAFGQLSPPDFTSEKMNISRDNVLKNVPSGPDSPPGLYEGPTGRLALNVLQPGSRLKALPNGLSGLEEKKFGAQPPRPLAGIFLFLAFLLLLFDGFVSFIMSGRLQGMIARLTPVFAFALMIPVILPESAMAQGNRKPAREAPFDHTLTDAVTHLRFAYIKRGDIRLDQVSQAGLKGLSRVIARRTSIEPESPRGLDISKDNLLPYPLIYWPVREEEQALPPETAAKVSAYLKSGGLIVFDTRDADREALRLGAPHPGLVNLLDKVDVPVLEKPSKDHVLYKSFYLLKQFTGRFSSNNVWIAAKTEDNKLDGISGLLIGPNDWASAWALSDDGMPVVSLGHENFQQYEDAHRFGVNLAMYVLTGNYKADQVHAPELLKRLEHKK